MSIMRTLLIIPTRNGRQDLERLFKSITKQTCNFDVCVVDSSSTDGTADLAREHGAIVHVIPVAEFNHGGTRQLMVDRYPGYDFYVFLTQDAVLADPGGLETLLVAFEDAKVGAVYGRQLPHHDAGPLGAHARIFNYPDESRVNTLSDAARHGIKAAFFSNSFAAYRLTALTAVRGFPVKVILSEDTYVAAKMLHSGWKIAYCAEAQVFHSHDYTVIEEFRRYFDTGVFHFRESWLLDMFGSPEGEGARFVMSELSYLLHHAPWLIPASVVRNLLKYAAYQLGKKEQCLPVVLKRHLSMHKGFWYDGGEDAGVEKS